MAKGKGIIDETALNLFTDGSSFPHKKRAAGIGVVFVWVNEAGDELTDGYSPPGWASATIDEVEIKAVTEGLIEAKRMFGDLKRFTKVLVFSDSLYVVENFTKAMKIWPKKKWRGADGFPVANIPLWKELLRAVNKASIPVDIQWVKGHKSSPHNKAADKLAKQSAAAPINRPFSITETTRKWSNRKTLSGCIEPKGQLLAIRVISREYVRAAKTTKYRYEVIDPQNANFKDVDFAYSEATLSRSHCYLARLNSDKSRATFVEIVEELDCDNYKF